MKQKNGYCMVECMCCDGHVKEFLKLGSQPIANGFISKKALKNETFFELQLGHCSSCDMVQLLEQPNENEMFHSEYPFFSSLSKFMQLHFRKEAKEVNELYLDRNSFIVELGSNDGIFLEYFRDNGIRHLGVEPSSNVAEISINKQIRTLNSFFNRSVAQKISEENGMADVLFAANVMCHISNIKSVIEGANVLLNEDGVIIFEDPYWGDIVKNCSYDQVYDEHKFYFTAHSVQNLFSQFGFELINLKKLDVHGGSMQYTLARNGRHKVLKIVKEIMTHEVSSGLFQEETYNNFEKRVNDSKFEFINLIKRLKLEGNRIAGYGATSKSTTLLNYCGVGEDLIEFICDTTPLKQEKLSPGVHIPIKSNDYFQQNHPDYVVLFAWNHKKEIMAKESEYKGKWITYFPKLEIF